MSPIDHPGYGAPRRPAHLWRRVVETIWSIEHAFERSKIDGNALNDARLRIFFILVVFSLVFVGLGVEAGKRALTAHGGGEYTVAAPPDARADLVDRNGNLLAVDLTHYGVYLDPRDVSPGHEQETRDDLLGALPHLSAERLDKAMKADRRQYLIGGLTRQERDRVHDLGRPGVEFEEEAKRVYPLGTTAAHLIGFVDGGGKGLAGAERALDPAIHAAAAGQGTVPLALDLRVQAALQDELNKAQAKFQTVNAMGIVVDVHTGEILAMASVPSFDPNDPGKSPMADLTDHGAASVYELGSVFKAFTLAAGLDSGIVTPNTTFDVHAPLVLGADKPIHDFDKGDTTLALWQVFTHSSNIGAAKLSLMAGEDRMRDYFKRFGLFGAAPSEMVESARPILPRRLDNTTLAHIAFGQGMAVSPLALATGYTAVMNGGVYIPLTIKRMPDGYVAKGRRVISPQTSETMLQLMRLNVHDDPKGSGHKADDPGLRVGGKTGSAQKPEHGHYGANNISSFVGVFPTDGPIEAKRYLVLITLDSPHVTKDSYGFITAGWNAAPTAGNVINRIAPFLGVKRTAEAPPPPSFAAPGLAAQGPAH